MRGLTVLVRTTVSRPIDCSTNITYKVRENSIRICLLLIFHVQFSFSNKFKKKSHKFKTFICSCVYFHFHTDDGLSKNRNVCTYCYAHKIMKFITFALVFSFITYKVRENSIRICLLLIFHVQFSFSNMFLNFFILLFKLFFND